MRADGGSPIQIDQAVHGYDRGHRLVRSSRTVDDDSARLMRAMSDLLTSRLLAEGESYLVGYPLKGSAAFVLARTWAAVDMPRPGSVWTHSLIFDYQSLTTLEDPSVIVGWLRKPSATDLDHFSAPISPAAHATVGREANRANEHPSAKSALAALYASNPARHISIARFTEASDEALLLALWRQAWPALRRDLAFITALDPKLPKLDASCVMSLTERPGSAFEASGADCDRALDALLDDLPNRRQTELRAFVGRHAFDAINPRAAVLPLVTLWKQMANVGTADLSTAVDIARAHTTSPRLARDIIDRLLVPPVTAATLTDFIAKFGSLQLGGPMRGLERVDSATLEGDLAAALTMSAREADGTIGEQVFARLASEAPASKLANTRLGDDVALRLAEVRPDILMERAFWSRSDSTRASIVSVASRKNFPLEAVCKILDSDLGPAVLRALVDGWPNQAPAMLFERLDDLFRHHGKAADAAAVLTFLGGSPGVVRTAVASGALVSIVAADAIIASAFTAATVTRPPPAIWLSLTKADPDLGVAPNLAVLTLCAALTGTAGSGISGLLRAFPVVEAAAAKRILPRSAEHYLEATFRDLHISTWRLSERVLESAVRAVLGVWGADGRLLISVNGRRQVDAVLDAIYYCGGLSAVRNVVQSAETMIEPEAIWKIHQSREYMKSKEKRGWFL